MSTSQEIVAAHEALVKSVKLGKAKPYEYRVKQLKGLKRFIQENMNILKEALKSDLRRSDFEGVGVEISTTAHEIDFILANLKGWMKPKQTAIAALFAPAKSEIHYEPYGLCLIIGAFNYPVILTVSQPCSL